MLVSQVAETEFDSGFDEYSGLFTALKPTNFACFI